MAYKITIDSKEYELTEEQFNKLKGICGLDSQAQLTTKTINDLNGLNFWIKDYQRGYRWTKTEVQDLLRDIDELDIDGEGYCMQPLVVKKIDDLSDKKATRMLTDDGVKNTASALPKKTYELLDGQQRLTTIFIISSYLEVTLTLSYSIYYELTRNVDDYYIKQSRETVEKWFTENSKFNKNCSSSGKIKKGKSGLDWNNAEKDRFISKLLRLFFIWYEVKDEKISAEKVFKSINEGKIDLTNAELFKALLLNPDNCTEEGDSTRNERKLQQIAFEWDKLEHNLHDDDFWYFISKDDVEKSSQKTRIDYIIEIYARKINESEQYGLDINKDRFSFLVIQKYLGCKRNNFREIKDVWENIVGVYNKLYSWYKDEELYHMVGFLVASEDIKHGSKAIASDNISELFQETKDKNIQETKEIVRKKVREQLIVNNGSSEICVDNISYEYPPNTKTPMVDKTTLKKILLFTNIYAIIFYKHKSDQQLSYTRFPFKHFNQIKNWDIEHISPRTVENDLAKECKNYKEFEDNINALREDLDENSPDRKIISDYLNAGYDDSNYKNPGEYSKILRIWTDYAKELSQTPDESIGNLVLLNASINRSYGNAFFNGKRKEIIENDMCGIFIPICTKNVFMKYYSDAIVNPTRWTDEDKKKYTNFIETMINEIKGWK